MAQFRVTDRTSPKIHGKIRPPGSTVELDMTDVSHRLIADALTEAGTLIQIHFEHEEAPKPKPKPRGRPPKRSAG